MLGLVQGAKTEADLSAATKKLTAAEKSQVQAFLDYVNAECSP